MLLFAAYRAGLRTGWSRWAARYYAFRVWWQRWFTVP
jgi:hypothetical protein